MDALLRLPAAVQPLALQYIALFRPAKSGLSWQRALKILTGLLDLVLPGQVQWDGCESRPAPPQLWAQAMQATIDRRPEHLTNHNYLRRTAWEMAASLAAEAERQREAAAKHRVHIPDRDDDAPASDEERAKVKQMFDLFKRTL
ncbi:MAG: hypothetical protein LLG06_11705 [Desulfobacteraceae bacterium]|nr:hypothetical protein [Desulfobacteraceae bacterium]